MTPLLNKPSTEEEVLILDDNDEDGYQDGPFDVDEDGENGYDW